MKILGIKIKKKALVKAVVIIASLALVLSSFAPFLSILGI